jgi:hypothetical protein
MKTCETCLWSEFKLNDRGEIDPCFGGTCTYKVAWPNVPSCSMGADEDRYGISPHDGVDCPCWKQYRLRTKMK